MTTSVKKTPSEPSPSADAKAQPSCACTCPRRKDETKPTPDLEEITTTPPTTASQAAPANDNKCPHDDYLRVVSYTISIVLVLQAVFKLKAMELVFTAAFLNSITHGYLISCALANPRSDSGGWISFLFLVVGLVTTFVYGYKISLV